jgi:hypothetical protein
LALKRKQQAPHAYDFVVLTSLTHPRKILLVVLQIGKAEDLSAPLHILDLSVNARRSALTGASIREPGKRMNATTSSETVSCRSNLDVVKRIKDAPVRI